MIRDFVILGASGDLTARYLLPTLAQLQHAGKLPANMRVLGVAPESWDTAYFQNHIRASLNRHAPDLAQTSGERLIAALEYRRADVTKLDDVKAALAMVNEAAVIYLSLPPRVFLSAPVLSLPPAFPPRASSWSKSPSARTLTPHVN